MTAGPAFPSLAAISRVKLTGVSPLPPARLKNAAVSAAAALAVVLAYLLLHAFPPRPRMVVPAETPAVLSRAVPEITLKGSLAECLATLGRATGTRITTADGSMPGPQRNPFPAPDAPDVPVPGTAELRLHDTTLGLVLRVLLVQTSGGRLYPVVAPDGSIIVTRNESKNPLPRVVRMYDLGDLRAEAVRFSDASSRRAFGRPAPVPPAETYARPLDEHLHLFLTDMAAEGFGGSWEWEYLGDRVFVLQTPENHQRLETLFAELAAPSSGQESSGAASSGGTVP